jgi:hypothetical protein
MSVSWQGQFKKLKAFRMRFGHLRIAKRGQPAEILELGRWLERQRARIACLSLDQLRCLHECPGVFLEPEHRWLARYFELVAYKKAHGDCRVPDTRTPGPLKSLGKWVAHQRRARDRLPLHRLYLLNYLGFDWTPLETDWRASYEVLRRFADRYGHCLVPTDHPDYPHLVGWMHIQRLRRQSGFLLGYQRKSLDQIGFDWDPHANYWMDRYRELAVFKKRFGHGNVPSSWNENRRLAGWVVTQRARWRRQQIPARQARLLNKLGFEWTPLENSWAACFRAFAAFRRAYPGRYPDPRKSKEEALASWVAQQRDLHLRGQLARDRRRGLERIGFRWKAP